MAKFNIIVASLLLGIGPSFGQGELEAVPEPTVLKSTQPESTVPESAEHETSLPPPPPPPAGKECGGTYKKGMKFTSDCGMGCAVPFAASEAVSSDSEADCLAACKPSEGCHCALFWPSKNQCSLKWTPCDSVMLNLAESDAGAVAVQPCIKYPITVSPKSTTSECGAGKPMKQYTGWMISKDACKAPGCISTTSSKDSIGACMSACEAEGYGTCKSVQYMDAEAFGQASGECVMYSERLEYMGAHASSQVLQVIGDKPAAVAASYCSAPESLAQYPTNSRPDFGVDWEAVCAGGKDMTTVASMQMGCGSCAFIPEDREDDESPYDADAYHFQTDSIESCMIDCKNNDNCGCAFWRPSDHTEGGYCALTNAECSAPIIGAQVDYTRIRTAITKCSYSASDDVKADWPDDTYEGIDWFGIWDDVCQSPGSFTYNKMDTYCGPGCILEGTATVKTKDKEECSKICTDASGCHCSFYSSSSGACTLMNEEGGACNNFPEDPDCLAYASRESNQNEVTVLCDDFDILDPAFYYY